MAPIEGLGETAADAATGGAASIVGAVSEAIGAIANVITVAIRSDVDKLAIREKAYESENETNRALYTGLAIPQHYIGFAICICCLGFFIMLRGK